MGIAAVRAPRLLSMLFYRRPVSDCSIWKGTEKCSSKQYLLRISLPLSVSMAGLR